MIIYLAARFARREELRVVRGILRAAGHQVTSRWLDGDHQATDEDLQAHPVREDTRRFAQEDLDDLLAADCVMSFTETPRSSASRGGRHVEFGLALGTGKLLFLVGPRENVFHCLPDVRQCADVREAVAALHAITQVRQGPITTTVFARRGVLNVTP